MEGQSAQGAGALWIHLCQLVIYELGNIVVVLVFHDAPEFAANEVIVFEMIEQLEPRGIHHQSADDRKRTGVVAENLIRYDISRPPHVVVALCTTETTSILA